MEKHTQCCLCDLKVPQSTELEKMLNDFIKAFWVQRVADGTAVPMESLYDKKELQKQGAMLREIKAIAERHAQTKVVEALREERERVRNILKGKIMSAVDFSMYTAKANLWDVDQREKHARDVEEKLLQALNPTTK